MWNSQIRFSARVPRTTTTPRRTQTTGDDELPFVFSAEKRLQNRRAAVFSTIYEAETTGTDGTFSPTS